MADKIRIEVYIPSWYNPDENGETKPIESRKRRHIRDEIIKKYGAISKHKSAIDGTWVDPEDGQKYFDLCKKWEVCINPVQNLTKELEDWQRRLKSLLKQKEVFMVHYPIEKIEVKTRVKEVEK